jgi:hypothetical protein
MLMSSREIIITWFILEEPRTVRTACFAATVLSRSSEELFSI